MNYAVDLGSDAMIYIPSIIKFRFLKLVFFNRWDKHVDTQTAR
jgi:hypothetical protein